jgi:hypothetical protein
MHPEEQQFTKGKTPNSCIYKNSINELFTAFLQESTVVTENGRLIFASQTNKPVLTMNVV